MSRKWTRWQNSPVFGMGLLVARCEPSVDYLVLSSFLTSLQEEVANLMTQSWQRLSPTERWLLIRQAILISSSVIAWAVANEASRQLDKYMERII
jgi:hypothetical protein